MDFEIAIHMRVYSMNLQAYRIVASFVSEELTKDLRYKHQLRLLRLLFIFHFVYKHGHCIGFLRLFY